MTETQQAYDGDVDSAPPPATTSTPVQRIAALLEIVLCSGYPTQIALAYGAMLAGWAPAAGVVSLTYVATLLLLDACLVLALVGGLMRLHGEGLSATFLGQRPVAREALLGLPLAVVVFTLVIVMLTSIQLWAPWLRNVPENPLAQLLQTGRDAAVFAVVATVAGGLREEVQRAFVLRRFERHLGGAAVGLVVFSAVFGLGHALQGWDAALTTGVLGVFWGGIYLVRGSIVAAVVSHSIFNLAEIAGFVLWGG